MVTDNELMKEKPPLSLVQLMMMMMAVDCITVSSGPGTQSPCLFNIRLSTPATTTVSCRSKWCSPLRKIKVVLEVK